MTSVVDVPESLRNFLSANEREQSVGRQEISVNLDWWNVRLSQPAIIDRDGRTTGAMGL